MSRFAVIPIPSFGGYGHALAVRRHIKFRFLITPACGITPGTCVLPQRLTVSPRRMVCCFELSITSFGDKTFLKESDNVLSE
jgi:hypothetical protein